MFLTHFVYIVQKFIRLFSLCSGSCSWYNNKRCTPCSCNKAGSLNMNCDKNGQCSCKSGFFGLKCTPCNCYEPGSRSTNCNKKGQCSCKPGFSGLKCTNRDCVMSPWRTTSRCKCPEKMMTRSRRVLSKSHGNGECGPLLGKIRCTVKCADECTQHEYGYNCGYQDCKAGPWMVTKGHKSVKEDDWNPCKDNSCRASVGQTTEWKTIHYERKRTVVIPRKGNGLPCPDLREMAKCQYKACVSFLNKFFTEWLG